MDVAKHVPVLAVIPVTCLTGRHNLGSTAT